MHMGHLLDRRHVNRTFQVRGGRAFIASLLSIPPDLSVNTEIVLCGLMDSNKPMGVDLGNGTRKPFALLEKWQADQRGDEEAIFTLTFREVQMAQTRPLAPQYIALGDLIFDTAVVVEPATGGCVSLSPCDHDECRATCKRSVCPECGPHGGKGRVLLLESWVDCLTCKAGAS